MTKRALVLPSLATLAALAACGDDGPTGPVVEVERRYLLVTYGGGALPAVTDGWRDVFRQELLGGELRFEPDGTCLFALRLQATEAGTTRPWAYGGRCTYERRVGEVRIDVERYTAPFHFRADGDRLVMVPATRDDPELAFAPVAGG